MKPEFDLQEVIDLAEEGHSQYAREDEVGHIAEFVDVGENHLTSETHFTNTNFYALKTGEYEENNEWRVFVIDPGSRTGLKIFDYRAKPAEKQHYEGMRLVAQVSPESMPWFADTPEEYFLYSLMVAAEGREDMVSATATSVNSSIDEGGWDIDSTAEELYEEARESHSTLY